MGRQAARTLTGITLLLTVTAAAEGPDVIIGDLSGVSRLAGDGASTAYGIGTITCNGGGDDLAWQTLGQGIEYPVLVQNLYVLTPSGRFEQIGLSWARHAICALQTGLSCSNGTCQPACTGCCFELSPHCATTNSSFAAGTQNYMGPRSQIDPSTGLFPLFDPAALPAIESPLSRRLHAPNHRLDPQLNPGTLYFLEAHRVAPDDAAAGAQDNNVSYRQVAVGSGPGFSLSFAGQTVATEPAIAAWASLDPDVVLQPIIVRGDGRFMLGARVTDLGDGTWGYEYALYNMNSARAAGGFTVPRPAGVDVTEIGFHDVDHHSGEIWDGTDWPATVNPRAIGWATDRFETNPNANALRWGTLYNFRFTANAAPAAADVLIDLFLPGEHPDDPEVMVISAIGPGPARPCLADTNGDDAVNVEDLVNVILLWATLGSGPGVDADLDDNGTVEVLDLVAVILGWGVCP